MSNSRRGRQSRRGQKYTAAPGDLRDKGKSGPVHRVLVVEDPGFAWVQAEELAELPEEELSRVQVQLDGRRIGAADLVRCFRWLFGEGPSGA